MTPYEKNAKKHERADIEAIKASINNLGGFNDPIGIWGDRNIIVEGHGRQIAALELGLETVPCIRLDHLTDEQRRAYALAHNKTQEIADYDFSILGEELAELELDFDMSEFGFEPVPFTFSVGAAAVLLFVNRTVIVAPFASSNPAHVTAFAAVDAAVWHVP